MTSKSGTSRLDLIQRVALPVAWVLLILGFGIANPDVFLTAATFQTMFGSQAVLLVLTLALIIPLTAGDYDLSVAGASRSRRCWSQSSTSSTAGRSGQPSWRPSRWALSWA